MTVKKNKEKGAFLRQCVGCGKRTNKNELIRIAKSPQGIVSIDFDSSSDGRGAYVCKNEDCIKKAAKNGRLNKTLRQTVPDYIYENLKLLADTNVYK